MIPERGVALSIRTPRGKQVESDAQRLISADSHVKMDHEQVKAHLPARLHEAYDEAAGTYEAGMKVGAGAANRAGATQKRTDQGAALNSVFTRPGYWDPHERLKDMDTDGVEAEVLYCEVSAFRYLYHVKDGWREAAQAFNDALYDFGSVDPKRLIVSYQIPIHDIDVAVAEVKRVAELGEVTAAAGVSRRARSARLLRRAVRPAVQRHEETDLPICCHIGLNTGLDELTRRDPTPNKGVMVPIAACRRPRRSACGSWAACSSAPRLKVVFVEPGVGWVAWWLYIVDDMVTRQEYEFPAITEMPSHYFHRNVFLTFIDEPDGVQLLRHASASRTSCGRPTTRTR